MPKVDLIASRDFTYNTRRLKAGDDFQARNRDDARILIEILGKARMGRPAATVAPPPADVAEKVEAAFVPTLDEVLGAEAVEEKPAPKRAKRKAKAKK